MAVLPWPNQYSQQQGTTAWNPESAFGKKQSQDWGAIAGNLQNQQLGFNNQQAALDFQYNRQNMNTPYGNINYTFNPDGTISQNTALSAGQQKVLTGEDQVAAKRAQSLAGALSSMPSSSVTNLPTLSYSNLPQLDYGSGLQTKTTQDAYNTATKLLGDSYDREAIQADAKLAARGIPVGSELYNTITKEREQRRADAYNTAANNAITLGQNAADTAYNQSLGARQQSQAEQNNMFTSKYNNSLFKYRYPLEQAQAISSLNPTSGQVKAPSTGTLSSIGTSGNDYLNNVLALGGYSQSALTSLAGNEAQKAAAAASAGATVRAAGINAGASTTNTQLNIQAQKDLLEQQARLSGLIP